MPSHAPREELLHLLHRLSFRLGEFTLASGKRSSFYVDARRTTMSGRGLVLVGELGLLAIRDAGWPADLVGGLTLGADPVAYAIAAASQVRPPSLDAFTVRKEAKQHGTGSRIEGPFRRGAQVVIVEDVVTTGGSAKTAIDVVTEAGATVTGVLAVVDREEGGRQVLEEAGYSVVSLTTLQELSAMG